jgi:hypothetical protein
MNAPGKAGRRIGDSPVIEKPKTECDWNLSTTGHEEPVGKLGRPRLESNV